VLGVDVSDLVVKVRAGKALPFEPGRRCRLRIKNRKAKAWWASPSVSGTAIWKESCDAILSLLEGQNNLVVLVTGGVDAGKSTFCTFLANVALKKGITACVVDGDIGQGDIAPPTAIGAALFSQPTLDLRDLDARLFASIGAISPAGIESLMTQRLGALCRQVRSLARLQIINTDGYVQDGGMQYKRALCDEILPDVVALLDGNSMLEDAIAHGTWKLVKVKASTQARKTWSDRRWRRYHQFLRFVGPARISADMSQIECRYLGHVIPRSYFSSPTLREPELGLTGVFVALESGGQIRGFGVVENIDSNRVELQTDLHEFDCIHLSNIRLLPGRAEQISWKTPDPGYRAT
jgi:polynucleotide 5'-hydroxyl-kinase GRC3/NOL9